MEIINDPVINEWGYVHPEYFDFGDREWVTLTEWKAWLDENNLEDHVVHLEYEECPFRDKYFEDGYGDLSGWSPTKPEGEGWFLGSMFDTEDGPYAVWLRNK